MRNYVGKRSTGDPQRRTVLGQSRSRKRSKNGRSPQLRPIALADEAGAVFRPPKDDARRPTAVVAVGSNGAGSLNAKPAQARHAQHT